MLGQTTDLSLDGIAALASADDSLWTLDKWQLWQFVDILADHDGASPAGRRLLVPQCAQTIGLVGPTDLTLTSAGPMVASSLFSCIAVLDDHFSFRPVWTPPWISALVPESRTGVTGVAGRDGWADVVTLAGKSDEVNGWVESVRGGGLVVTMDGDEVLGGLTYPRHPRWWGDRLLVMEAGTGRLLSIDRDGTSETVVTVPGVGGGLAVHDRWALVGFSAATRAGIDGLEGGAPRPGGAPEDGLCLVDLTAGTVVGRGDVRRSCGSGRIAGGSDPDDRRVHCSPTGVGVAVDGCHGRIRGALDRETHLRILYLADATA